MELMSAAALVAEATVCAAAWASRARGGFGLLDGRPDMFEAVNDRRVQLLDEAELLAGLVEGHFLGRHVLGWALCRAGPS